MRRHQGQPALAEAKKSGTRPHQEKGIFSTVRLQREIRSTTTTPVPLILINAIRV